MSSLSFGDELQAIVPDFEKLEYSKNRDETFRLIQKEFIKCARIILQERKLVSNNHSWSINALELYLYQESIWPDETTHFYRFQQEQQLQRGTWYVHRNGTPAPNRSGIDLTAGCEKKRIAAGILLAAIGDRPGSATAFKAIVRPDIGYTFKRNDRWSDKERLWIQTINGTSIFSERLTIKKRASPLPTSLWIGPRKLGKNHRDTEFGRRHLRIANFRTTNPPMEPLTGENSIGSQ